MSTASVPSSPGLVIASVTVDCTDAARLAGFWAQVLGRQLADGAHQHFAMLAPNGAEPMMMFIAVPDRTPGKNSWHLDLRPAGSADQLESELTRITGSASESRTRKPSERRLARPASPVTNQTRGAGVRSSHP